MIALDPAVCCGPLLQSDRLLPRAAWDRRALFFRDCSAAPRARTGDLAGLIYGCRMLAASQMDLLVLTVVLVLLIVGTVSWWWR